MTKKKTNSRIPMELKDKFASYELSSVIEEALHKFLDKPHVTPKRKYEKTMQTRYTIDPELEKKIKQFAKKKGKAANAILIMALEQYEVQ